MIEMSSIQVWNAASYSFNSHSLSASMTPLMFYVTPSLCFICSVTLITFFFCFFSPSGSFRHHHVATRGKYGLVECVALSVCSCSLSVDLEEEAANVAACCALRPLIPVFSVPNIAQSAFNPSLSWVNGVSHRTKAPLDGDNASVHCKLRENKLSRSVKSSVPDLSFLWCLCLFFLLMF